MPVVRELSDVCDTFVVDGVPISSRSISPDAVEKHMLEVRQDMALDELGAGTQSGRAE